MRIAVAYQNGEIAEHFGHCEMFAVYDYSGTTLDECTKTLVSSADRHGHAQMAELMKEQKIDAVIVGRMGDEARSMLLSFGIVPVVGYCGDADQAADLLVTGQLPVYEGEGACGGGCGGCGGGCGGHAEGEDCGCGGGCCH